MAASGSYDVHTAHQSVQAELQRLAAQARSGWEKEARVLSWFGVRDGQSILEYRDALVRFAAAPEAYTLWLSILVCGEKPHDERWRLARLAAPNPQAA